MVFAGIARRHAKSVSRALPSSRAARWKFPSQPGKTEDPWIQSTVYVIDLRTQHHHHHQILFAKPRAKHHNAGAIGVGGLTMFNIGVPTISKNKLLGY